MDFRLPSQARVRKTIPKSRFFERVSVGAKERREFVDLIRKIVWEYKLAPDTIGVPKTDVVEEIQVFVIELKNRTVPKKALSVIGKAIPYPILFVLVHDGHHACAISLRATGENRLLVSGWDAVLEFSFSGTNLEAVYQGLVKPFLGVSADSGRDFATIVEADKRKKLLEREITALENKMRSEKQFKKKVELNAQLQIKKRELEKVR
jgi:hypothetical protein